MKSNFNKQVKTPRHKGVDHRATELPMSSTWGKSSRMVILHVRSSKIPLDLPGHCCTGLGGHIYPTRPSPSTNRPLTHFYLGVPASPLPLGLLQSCLKLHLGYIVDLGSPAQWLSGSPVQSEGAVENWLFNAVSDFLCGKERNSLFPRAEGSPTSTTKWGQYNRSCSKPLPQPPSRCWEVWITKAEKWAGEESILL